MRNVKPPTIKNEATSSKNASLKVMICIETDCSENCNRQTEQNIILTNISKEVWIQGSSLFTMSYLSLSLNGWFCNMKTQ